MAESSELFGFSIGSIVACKTCYNKEIEGEVLAFDAHTKMLVLKTAPSNGRTSGSTHDVNMINLSLVSDVQVKREAKPKDTPTAPPSINTQRLSNRARNQIEEKRRLITAQSAGVSPEGQKLFLAITKTIDEVTWQGTNIIVMKQVTIEPPYKMENVKGIVDSKALIHVKKVVKKHLEDQAEAAANSTASVCCDPRSGE